MNQITSCQSKAISLNQILTSSSIQLPVYTRFQKVDQYLTVPVMSLQVVRDGIQIQTLEGASVQIRFDELQDIVTFQDASGKTIFLRDFDGESRFAEELVEENEAKTEAWHNVIIAWQKQYVPSDGCSAVVQEALTFDELMTQFLVPVDETALDVLEQPTQEDYELAA